MRKNKSAITKITLSFLILISSIFIIGCSTKGKEDEVDVRYEFCPGKYFYSAGGSYKMFYYATNQSQVEGSLSDPSGKVIYGSGFRSPVNMADDNNGMWVADGFYEDKNNEYGVGTYTLRFDVKSKTYRTDRYMQWDGFPTWKSTPTFDTTNANTINRMIYVRSSGITTDVDLSKYTVYYRIKVYVAGLTTSRLFGQSEKYTNSNELHYYLPKVSQSINLVPVLVAELYQNGKIQKIMYYPGNQFAYNQ